MTPLLPPAGAAMREVKPLGDEQWAMLVEQLEKGPTPEMVRAVELAKERIKHIVEVDPYEFERRRRRAFGARDSASASG